MASDTNPGAGPGHRSSWLELASLGFASLTITLGLQALWSLVPLLVYVLQDRMGWHPYQVGLLAFALFGTGFLFGAAYRLLGGIRLTIVSAVGIGLIRFVAQAWQGDPLVDLGLTATASVLLFFFLPAYLLVIRAQETVTATWYAMALLLGMALHATILGGFATYDPFWREGAAALAVVGVMVTVQLACLVAIMRPGTTTSPVSRDPSDGGLSWTAIAPWLAIGPFLFIHLQVLQNTARLSALTGWGLPLAFTLITVGNVAALIATHALLSLPVLRARPVVLALGIVLTACLSLERQDPSVAAITLVAGQLSAMMLMGLVMAHVTQASPKGRLKPITMVHGVGVLSLTAFLFGYYVAFELAVPYDKSILPPLAGAFLGLLALLATTKGAPLLPARRTLRALPAAVPGLLLVPLLMLATWDTASPVEGDGYPVRVMSYNLHNGFGSDGRFDLEAIARVIEGEGADVVGLQEVNRGWAINGPADVLEWLSHRLDMPYIYGPTTGPMWGNAILSRYPIIEWQAQPLPPRDLQLTRGFLWARVDLGQGQELMIVNTHLHNREGEGHIREEQSRSLADHLGRAEQTVLMGDLNATPDAPEIKTLLDAGLVDPLQQDATALTSPATQPVKRIDYIMATSDLTVVDVTIPATTASDHLPVVATVAPR